MISALPGPLGVMAWDAIWTLKNPLFREQRRAQRRVYDRLGRPTNLLAGPFAGMRYIERATGSAYLPKIVGTYEAGLVPAIESIIMYEPDVIIDVGAAEGYYAVGFALRLKSARIIACDIYKPARYLLRKLAVYNGVTDRIDLRTRCTPTTLEKDVTGAARPVIICDCEGYEDDLLNPALAPALARAAILVELHEMFRPGVSARIRERFKKTHDIATIRETSRVSSMLPPNLGLNATDEAEAMNERRAEVMEWFHMTPRCP